ncbi:hypothetical protein V1264_000698 [Littorina saxatilis]|uniref:Reverse transcriptase n=1 Tax=Littorina saxatilis TaxID=31220 RepID=A0AAN9GNV0_9CAEN
MATSVDAALEATRILMDKGKLLGLEGSELRDFVLECERENGERAERARERAERAEIADAERKRADAERERERADAERERERERADRVEREREEREQQTRLEELRIQVELTRATNSRDRGGDEEEGNQNNNNHRNHRPRDTDNYQPKLPFLEDKDDVEAFLLQFERHAEASHWDPNTWSVRLSALLKGKARTAYTKMKVADARDYALLRKTLLERFQITAETYRQRFRNTRKENADSYKEFITQISLFLDRWVEMSNIGESFDDFKDLILTEQVYESMPTELVTYVKDRKPNSIDDVIDTVNLYEENRPKESRRHGKKPEERGHKAAHGTNSTNKDKDEGNKSRTSVKCFRCGKLGHFKKDCRQPPKDESASAAFQDENDVEGNATHDQLCDKCVHKKFTKLSQIVVEGQVVTAFRDTGSTSTIVDSKLVPASKITTRTKETSLAKKSVKEKLSVAHVYMDTPYFVGETEVSVMENPVHPVLIGNSMGVGSEKIETPVYPVRETVIPETTATAVTRGQEKREEEGNASIPSFPMEGKIFTVADLKREQQDDKSLEKLHVLARTNVTRGRVQFIYDKDVLYRQYSDKQGKDHRQVVVPHKMRAKVLSTGHDTAMSGHLGQKKSRERIWQDFFWPGIVGDIKRYCSSCDVCQRTMPKGRTRKVPLGKMPLIETPFKRVAVDIVGPIKPMSETKKQYILVMVDFATRYPEAVALKDIKAETVADALWTFWTRLGLPEEVLTDNGAQFTSELMTQVNQLLAIKGLTTSPWHPQCNGVVERFNGTLKAMLKKMTFEQPTKWDQYLPALLFAYREVPQDSLGFSPFELLYGRTVRGPMQVLRQLWTEEESNDEIRTTAEHVIDLRNRIEETCKIARDHLAKSAIRQAHFYDKKTKKRELIVGTRVLLLLPTKHNKLELAWKGPYVIEEQINSFDYKIKVGRQTRVYHINLLREYHEREMIAEPEKLPEEVVEQSAIVVEDLEEQDDEIFANMGPDPSILIPSTKRTENEKDVHVADTLTARQQREVRDACTEFSASLTDVPKATTLEICNIKMTDDRPVYVKPRPIPHALVDVVEREVKEMLDLKVIEPATSPYNAPIVIVKKAQGKAVRFCNDFREANKVIENDAEPITDVEHLFSELADARYFSKLDLTKGYWAIPIKEEDRDKTAFTTSLGQMRWINMPFGLKTAGSVFNRMMRKLLGPLNRKDVYHFMDDILIATATWEQHIEAIKAVLKALKDANLAAKPSKCYFGYEQLQYLGHEIGRGKRWPVDDKVDKIQKAQPPTTKKELRAFLGLTGFYRIYVPAYSSIAAPLTDKTKKQEPEKVKWTPACQVAFDTLKAKLAEQPIIQMPDHTLPYILRTDASDKGMGAVLLQDKGEGLQPIAYASKKLSETEQKYATVEKECLATVWGIQKFERYLYGRHFILETDHQPLQYLQRMKPTNARLMRWALQLQPYVFTVKIIPGKDNIGADYLSRATMN